MAAPLFADIDLTHLSEELNSVHTLANPASNENISHFQLSERDLLNSLIRSGDQQLSVNPAPGTEFVDSDDLWDSLSSLLPDRSTQTGDEILASSNDESDVFGSSLYNALFFSIVNGFAGLEGLPAGSLIGTLKSVPNIRERLSRYICSQPPPFGRSLIDNLFRAAVEALDEDAVMITFHIADNLPEVLRYGIDQSIACKAFDGDRMYTPIMFATKFRHVGIVRALLDRGYGLERTFGDHKDEDHDEECGLLDIALRQNENFETLDITLIDLIVENGAHVRPRHVLTAARWGEVELTKRLLSFTGRSEHHAFFGYEDGRISDPPPPGAGVFYHLVKFPNDDAFEIFVTIFHLCEDFACQQCPKGAQTMLEDIIFHATVKGNHQLVHFLLRHVPEDFSALSAAVRNGDRSMIDLMLGRGSSVTEPVRQMNESLGRFRVDEADVIPTTPLAEAIRSQDEHLVEELEALGALDSLKDHLHFVAAIYATAEAAIEKNHTKLAVVLINAGSEIDPDSDTNNPLLEALKRRNRVVANRILEVATPPFSFSSRASILEAAVRWGDTSIIKDLVLMGCCVGGGPLALAVELGGVHLVQLLLEHGTPLGDTALLSACKKGDEAMIRLLLGHGASPGDGSALLWSKDNNPRAFNTLVESFMKSYLRCDEYLGGIALISAIETDAHELVDVILTVNLEAAKAFTTHRGMDRTALGVAISHQDGSNFYAVDQLLRRGIGVNSIVQRPSRRVDAEIIGTENCSYGHYHFANGYPKILSSLSTALLAAIGTKNEKLVDFLIEHGADINQPARRGVRYTPLQYACVVGRFKIIAGLVEHGADIKAPPAENGGGTALQFAAISGRIKIAQFLLARGADPNEPSAPMNGRTALEGAAEHGRLDMIKLLFETAKGAFTQESLMRANLLARDRGHAGCSSFLALLSNRLEGYRAIM
ncbi:unnamed protein product [Clonostachys byssicola]|uniref:Uncharacterized protein n=1 Tax=Clonostachys byssicola TaxID=160290 RepID=A0A9N9UYD3_9HYPO|nr:unnamed protein product [Clonostachys byssicola]